MLFNFLWMIAIVVTLLGAWKSLIGKRQARPLERHVFVEDRSIEIRGPVVDTEPLEPSQRQIAARARKCEEVW